MHGFLEKDYGFHESFTFFLSTLFGASWFTDPQNDQKSPCQGATGPPRQCGWERWHWRGGRGAGCRVWKRRWGFEIWRIPDLKPWIYGKNTFNTRRLLGYFDQLSSFSCITLNIQCTENNYSFRTLSVPVIGLLDRHFFDSSCCMYLQASNEFKGLAAEKIYIEYTYNSIVGPATSMQSSSVQALVIFRWGPDTC